MIQRVEEILFDGTKNLTAEDSKDKCFALVKLCAMSLRYMLVAMGQLDSANTKEIMQLLTKDFCVVCGAYYPSECEGPCESCQKESGAVFDKVR